MPSMLKMVSITLGIVSIVLAIVFLMFNLWLVGIVFLSIAILLLFAGFLLFSNPISQFNSQLQMPSQSTPYINQNSYQNPFKRINTLSGFRGRRSQGGGTILLILGIVFIGFGFWIIGIILLYGAIKLLMNPMQLNLQAQQPTSSVSGDNQDGFEDEPIISNAIISGYVRS